MVKRSPTLSSSCVRLNGWSRINRMATAPVMHYGLWNKLFQVLFCDKLFKLSMFDPEMFTEVLESEKTAAIAQLKTKKRGCAFASVSGKPWVAEMQLCWNVCPTGSHGWFVGLLCGVAGHFKSFWRGC